MEETGWKEDFFQYSRLYINDVLYVTVSSFCTFYVRKAPTNWEIFHIDIIKK